jgi:hypothetical protein
MSYRKRLACLDESRSKVTEGQERLILLTGQSSFVSSRLSPVQADFLTAVAPPDVEPLLLGFPYHAEFDGDVTEPGLAAASIRNALQFGWSLFSSQYQRSVARVLQILVRKTSVALYIVTGSCGLQILQSAWPLIVIPESLRVRVVAVGPAMLRAGAQQADRIRAVQGHRDLWSRLLYRGRIEERCNCGHMNYWSSLEVREVVARILRDRGPS